MSYDINTNKFLGIKVVDSVKTYPYDNECAINDLEDGSTNIFVKLDEKYSKILDANKPLLADSRFSQLDQMTAQSFMEINGRSCNGPTGTFIRSILLAAGIKEDNFYKTNLISDILVDVEFLPHKFTPLVFMSKDFDEDQNCAVVEVNNKILAELIRGLVHAGELNVQDPKKTQGCYVIPCMRKALENLLEMYESTVNAKESSSYEGRDKIYALEKWMRRLISKYGLYLGIDINFEVLSSFYGDLIRDGGMERNIPYIVFDDIYYIEDWEDPRVACPEKLAEAKKFILEEGSPIEWELFSPQFGG